MDGVEVLNSLPPRHGESERFWCANNIPSPLRENLATVDVILEYRGCASARFPAACTRRFRRAAIHLLFSGPWVSAQFPSMLEVASQGLVPADWFELLTIAPARRILLAAH